MTILNKDNDENKKPEEEDKDKIEGQIIMSSSSNEPNKENEELDKNKVIVQNLSKDESENNKDKPNENEYN